MCDYIGFSYLRTFAARKNHFAAVFYICICACTLYIGETSKSVLFAVCSRLFLFSFSLAFCFTKFVCETLCKFLNVYASLKCMFMHNIMINRKLCGNFGFFSTFAANV
nr:MAG TPA: hypothetical protein [Caudoviricetes sp.]